MEIIDKPALTQRQAEVYQFLKARILNHGHSPTVHEIAVELGIRSTNSVLWHLKALEKKGLIVREPNLARAIQLTNRPISRSALADIGRLDGSHPWEALDRGHESDFAPLFESGDNFAVTATGNDLIDAHVTDGDTVVLTPSMTARNGEIVLALVADGTPVLRFYFKATNRVQLQASGKTKPIVSGSIQILGKAIAIIRKLS